MSLRNGKNYKIGMDNQPTKHDEPMNLDIV